MDSVRSTLENELSELRKSGVSSALEETDGSQMQQRLPLGDPDRAFKFDHLERDIEFIKFTAKGKVSFCCAGKSASDDLRSFILLFLMLSLNPILPVLLLRP